MTEPKPMIENSDRGITLAKPLAWVMLVGIISGGIVVGTQVGELTTAIAKISAAIEQNAADTRLLDGRLRAVENASAVSVSQYRETTRSLDEIKVLIRELAQKVEVRQ